MAFRNLNLISVSIGAVLALSGAGPARATLIQYDDPTLPASGDGFNITRDTVTGLEWLDVDVSDGRTFDDLTGVDGSDEFAVGGDFAGWRYATDLELTGQTVNGQIDSLAKSFGVGPPSFSYIAGYAFVRPLITLMGCAGSCASYGYVRGTLLSNSGTETEVSYQAFAYGGDNWGRAERGGFSLAATNDGFPQVKGNWLVRSIPEPSTALLLASGLAALSLRRRRPAA